MADGIPEGFELETSPGSDLPHGFELETPRAGPSGPFNPSRFEGAEPGSARAAFGQESRGLAEAMQHRPGTYLEQLNENFKGATKRINEAAATLRGERPAAPITPAARGEYTPGMGTKPLYGAPVESAEVTAGPDGGLIYTPGPPKKEPTQSGIEQTARALADIATGAASQAMAPATAAVRQFGTLPLERATGIPAEKTEEAAMIAAGFAPGVRGAAAVERPPARGGPMHGDILPPEPGTAPTTPRPQPPTIEGEVVRAEPREGLDPNVRLLQPTVPHSYASERGNLGAAGGTDPLADLSPQARQILQERFDAQGFNEHTIEQRIEEMSPHEILGEVSPDFEGHTAGIRSQPGAARNEITQTVQQRHRESPERIENELNQAFGENINRTQWETALRQARANESRPFWQQFNDLQIPPSPDVEAILPRLEASGASAAANKALRTEGLPLSTGFPEEAVAADQTRVPTARAFQYAKEYIDDKIEAAIRAGENNQARILTTLKRDLVSAIDNHPDPTVAGVWKQARDVWARPTSLLKAKDLGETLLTSKVHPEQIQEIVRGLSPPERQALLYGVRGYFQDLLGRPGSRVPTTILDQTLSRANREKITALIGEDQANALFEAFEHEQRIRGAPTRLLHGSPTAERRAYQEQWGPDALNPRLSSAMEAAGAGADLLRDPLGTLRRGVGRMGGDWLDRRKEAAAQGIREEIGRILTLQGPERDAVLRQLAGVDQRVEGPPGGGPPPSPIPSPRRPPSPMPTPARPTPTVPTPRRPPEPSPAGRPGGESAAAPQLPLEESTQRSRVAGTEKPHPTGGPIDRQIEDELPAHAQAKPLPGPLPNDVRMFRPGDLQVDANRFQFKAGGDESGVTDRLKGVKKWDPIKAGMVLVWEDRNGNAFIADGHQRHGLATRIAREDPEQDPQLLARVLRESDGITDAGARTIAALKNIAEGTGSAIDAAKVLRENPESAGHLPPRSDLVRQARGLVNLDDDAFRMVINDVVPPNYAAIVGHLVPEDAKLQSALLGLLAKTEPANSVQAESIVRQGINAGVAAKEKSAQAGLFGDEDVATSLYLDRAKILDKALKDIKRDKTVFAVLSKEQEMIEQAGNKLAADVNTKRAAADAQVLQVLQTLANRTGPISDALGDAAKQSRAGQTAAAVRGFVAAIRGMVESGDLARLTNGIERGATHVGDESPAGLLDLAPEKAGVTREENATADAGRIIQRAAMRRPAYPTARRDEFAERPRIGAEGRETRRGRDINPAADERILEEGAKKVANPNAADEILRRNWEQHGDVEETPRAWQKAVRELGYPRDMTFVDDDRGQRHWYKPKHGTWGELVPVDVPADVEARLKSLENVRRPYPGAKRAAQFFLDNDLEDLVPGTPKRQAMSRGEDVGHVIGQPMRRPGSLSGRDDGTRSRIGEQKRAERAKPPIGEARNTAILEAGYERATGTDGPRVVTPEEQERILRKNWEEHGPEDDNYEKLTFPGPEMANSYFRSNGDMELTAYTSLKDVPRDYRPPKRQAMAREHAEQLQSLIKSGASLDELAEHPAIKQAVAESAGRKPTGSEKDLTDPAWRAGRVYDFKGEKVHGTDAAVARLIDKAKSYSTDGPVEKGQHAIIVMGPPAAGKSTVSDPLARRYRAAVVDADDAKLPIPEYDNGIGAAAVHEESSGMAKEVLSALMKDGSNIILPKVGDSVASIRRLALALREKGYNVDLAHVAATPQISGLRNIVRFLKTGRLVPPDYLTAVGDKPRENYHVLKEEGIFNETADFSTAASPIRALDGEHSAIGRAVSAGNERNHGPGPAESGPGGAKTASQTSVQAEIKPPPDKTKIGMQEVLGGTGHSAKQLAASREASGHGKMRSTKAQKESAGPLFEESEGKGQLSLFARGGAVGPLPLITRKQSNYAHDRGKPDHHCGPDKQWPHGFCAKFRGPHRCTAVAGFIATKGGCDWYRRAEERQARADGGPTFDQRFRGDKGDNATFGERFGGDTESRLDQDAAGDIEDRRGEPFLSPAQMASVVSHERKGARKSPHPLYADGGAVNHAPTDAQKEAGNYEKRHVRIHGLDISIENEKGATRSGVGRDGKPWSVKMPYGYGYIRRTKGADGDHVDVCLGPHLKSEKVFVVDQKDAETGRFDEHKVFIGFGSAEQVHAYYLRGFSDGKGKHRLGHITEMSIGRFKAWLDRGDTTKPLTQRRAA